MSPDYEWLTELDKLQRAKTLQLREQADVIHRIEWRLATALQAVAGVETATLLDHEQRRFRAMLESGDSLDTGWWPEGFRRVG